MFETKIRFSEDEMCGILQDIGYTIDTVRTWEIDSRTSNSMNDKEYVKVAFKGSKPAPKEYHLLTAVCGIHTVFKKEFKERLINKLF